MTLLDKLRWTLGLVVVFLLLLLTGRSNVHGSKKVQAAIETLYADRLVVKDLIFDLGGILHAKELALATGDLDYFDDRNLEANERALELLDEFRETYLVPLEETTLARFQRTFDALVATERRAGLDDGVLPGAEDAVALTERLQSLEDDLEVLSRIQIDEGRRQLMLGDQAVEDMDLVATIETYLLAVIGILAIGVILFIPKRTAKA